jgi:hypothetical protein
MSTVTLTTIAAPAGGAVTLASGTLLRSPGMVVQTIYARSDARSSYSSPNSGNGVTVTDLNLVITPRFASSLLIMQWMINAEWNSNAWNNVFVIHKNGALITDDFYQGYNRFGGNSRWSGFTAGMYDNNSDSTMSNYFLQYAIPAIEIVQQTFSPAVRSGDASNYTFFLNRCAGSTGADNYEVAVSSGVIWEVAQ